METLNVTAEFESAMAPLQKTFLEMPWDDKHVYGAWLAQTFYYVSHSTRLLALSAALCKQDQGSFHSRFVEHLREEKGHEALAVKDLENLGLKLKDFPETAELSAFYQTQYYWIEHKSPLSFYGYVLCLEGLAVRGGQDVYNKLIKLHGAPAATFLKVHATEDVGHLEKAFEYTQRLSAEDKAFAVENMKMSCALYNAMLTKVASLAKNRKASKAA